MDTSEGLADHGNREEDNVITVSGVYLQLSDVGTKPASCIMASQSSYQSGQQYENKIKA